MGKTKIPWAEHVWNPVTGCTPVGAGCAHCYARRMFNRFNKDNVSEPAPWKTAGIRVRRREFSEVAIHYDRLDQPMKRRKPTHYFVCSMGDLFHADVKDEWVDKVHDVILNRCGSSTGHTFTILTKRPSRMRDYYIKFYESLSERLPNGHIPRFNLRLYVSVWDQESANEFIPILLDTPAAVRGVSIEPMLGPIYPNWSIRNLRLIYGVGRGGKINHVILGGETGPGARPMHPDWARSVRDQCQAAGVPYFFKQWGEWAPECNLDPTNYQDAISINNACCDIGDEGSRVYRIGKKRAGNLLDTRTWEEMP